MKYRIEFDSIGKIKVPGDKYWGASTERSNKYFNIGFYRYGSKSLKKTSSDRGPTYLCLMYPSLSIMNVVGIPVIG